jgi:hypothetical protein
MSDRKTEPRKRAFNESAIVSHREGQSAINNESQVPESVDLKSNENRSHLPSILGRESSRNQSVFFGSKAKGYYDLTKMFGR